MNVRELRDNLDRLIAADAHNADLEVTYGQNMDAVQGGLIAKTDGRATLNLIPFKFSAGAF